MMSIADKMECMALEKSQMYEGARLFKALHVISRILKIQ